MSDLHIQMAPQPDGAVVVTLNGQLDIPGAGTLERQLTTLLVRHPKHVVFDVTDVTFISSLAMGVLMTFRRGCTTHGGRITLAGAHPMIAGSLKHAGLQTLLPMSATVEEALASVATPQPAK